MRVLMLGWEFPPHISGGLGTACKGIAEGVVSHGVEVRFILPRATGDEEATGVTVVGCSDRGRQHGLRSPGTLASVPSETMVLDHEEGAPFECISVESCLRPYSSPGAAPAERTTTKRFLPRKSGAESVSQEPGSPLEREEFSGSYGPGLIGEVHRYAHVVADMARRFDFDVIHAHDWMTYPAAIELQRLTGKPVVVHVHATEFDRSGDATNHVVEAIERAGVLAADRVACVSRYTATIVQDRYGVDPSTTRVVHNAVDLDLDSHEPPARVLDNPLVLFLGRVTFQKGPEYFLRAARRVADVRPDVVFVMSGSGDVLPRIIEEAAELGLASRIHFTGFLRGADVGRMYEMADVYVLSSVSEPFGITPLEAVSRGVPTVISRQSGVSEVLQHSLRANFWDVDEMANKILAILEHPVLHKTLATEGRVEVRQLSWQGVGRVIRDIYEELV